MRHTLPYMKANVSMQLVRYTSGWRCFRNYSELLQNIEFLRTVQYHFYHLERIKTGFKWTDSGTQLEVAKRTLWFWGQSWMQSSFFAEYLNACVILQSYQRVLRFWTVFEGLHTLASNFGHSEVKTAKNNFQHHQKGWEPIQVRSE